MDTYRYVYLKVVCCLCTQKKRWEVGENELFVPFNYYSTVLVSYVGWNSWLSAYLAAVTDSGELALDPVLLLGASFVGLVADHLMILLNCLS